MAEGLTNPEPSHHFGLADRRFLSQSLQYLGRHGRDLCGGCLTPHAGHGWAAAPETTQISRDIGDEISMYCCSPVSYLLEWSQVKLR